MVTWLGLALAVRRRRILGMLSLEQARVRAVSPFCIYSNIISDGNDHYRKPIKKQIHCKEVR